MKLKAKRKKYGTRKFGKIKMRSLQKNQLFFDSQQEKAQRKIGNEKTLSVLQKTYDTQRDEVTGVREGIKFMKFIKSWIFFMNFLL